MGRPKHNGKWKCPNSTCPKEFNHKQSLNNHNNSLEKCNVCSKTFSRKSYMKKHKRSIKPSTECSIYGKLFNKNWHLQRHINQMHTSKKNQNTEKQTQKNLKVKKLIKIVCKTLNLEQLDKVNENDLEALTELWLLQSYFADDNGTLVPSMISNNLIDLPEYHGNLVISTARYMKQVCYISLHSFSLSPPPLFVKGAGGGAGQNRDFKRDMLMEEDFFWNSGRGNKKWRYSMFCGSSVGGTCQGWSTFP